MQSNEKNKIKMNKEKQENKISIPNKEKQENKISIPNKEKQENKISIPNKEKQEDKSLKINTTLIDINALWVIKRLKIKGFQGYLTGGCVRDLLLNKTPKDFDVATNAKPNEIKSIFKNCRLIGRRFLLAHVFFSGGKIIETATFRANPSKIKNKIDKDLLLTQDNVFGSLEEDAKRRDFTVNGLFYDPVKEKIYDFLNAKEDLKNKIIKTIGDPDIRLREDPVRILRGIKFAAKLNFHIEEKTLIAMKKYACELIRCAPTRLQEELLSILTSGNSISAIDLCIKTGVLKVLMPELIVESNSEINLNDIKKELIIELNKNQKNILKTLDEISARECSISVPVVFSAILLPIYKFFKSNIKDNKIWIDNFFLNWNKRIRLTKKNQDKIKLLLSTALIMSNNKIEIQSGKKIIEKNWFKEALLIHIIDLSYEDKSLDSVEKWKHLAQKNRKSYMQEKKTDKKNYFIIKKNKTKYNQKNYK